MANKYTCPCCGYKTLEERPPGTHDICPICYWEDDQVQFDDPDYKGGANDVSLREAQKNFIAFGASDTVILEHVRKPTPEDEKDPNWKQLNMFTDKEINLLNSITEGFSKRAKHAKIQTFEDFIGDLNKFLEEVEEGYTMTIDDYTNDLIDRDQADELVKSVPEPIKKKIIPFLEEWDSRFKSATRVLQNQLLKENPPWWWYRIPKKLTGDLKEDVETLNIN